MSKHPGGRPTKYNEKYHPQLIQLLARLGYTDQESAEFLGICKATLDNWKCKHKEFLVSIKKGKDDIVNQIEHALYKRAVGYEFVETDIEYETTIIEAEPEKVKKVKEKRKQMAPDPTSIIFSLKNLKPEKWRDKKDINMSGNFNVMNFDVPVSEEEMQEAKKQLKLFLEQTIYNKEDLE